MAFNGKTPSEVAGLDFNLGNNKWHELIKLASGDRHLTPMPEVNQIQQRLF
jgi:hypothetical protein